MPFGWGSASPPPFDTPLPRAGCQCLINGSDPAHHICQRHEILCSSDFARHIPPPISCCSPTVYFHALLSMGHVKFLPSGQATSWRFLWQVAQIFYYLSFTTMWMEPHWSHLVHQCYIHKEKKITFPWCWSLSWNCKWKMNVCLCVCLELSLCTEKKYRVIVK